MDGDPSRESASHENTPRGADVSAPPQEDVYRERLRVPPWWYPAGLVIAGIFGSYPAAYFSGRPFGMTLIYAASALVVCLLLWAASRREIRVQAGELRTGDIAVPLAALGPGERIDRAVRAITATTYAQTVPWIPGGVWLRVSGDDQYVAVVLSTRRPHQLLAALGVSSTAPPS
jgi:hypothetical protein